MMYFDHWSRNIAFDSIRVPNLLNYNSSSIAVSPTLSRIVTTFGKLELIDPDVSITKNIVTKNINLFEL